MRPTAHLVSWTKDPIRTLYKIWWASKQDKPLTDKEFTHADPDEVLNTFLSVYEQEVPVIENIVFTFILDNVSVSFREQMVRHRVGVEVGDRVGCDIIPELGKSSWWSQSMRIMDMGEFAKLGRYRIADSIQGNSRKVYESIMEDIEKAYNILVTNGVPMEDARDVIPLGATHRISWTLNLRAMKHLIGKRSCWILQASLWHDIIKSMIDELASKINPVFRTMAYPPCVNSRDDEFNSCVFVHENERRMDVRDKLPPCPLWLNKQSEHAGQRLLFDSLVIPMKKDMKKRAERYREFWNHDPYTWEKSR